MIKQPNELSFEGKTFTMIIYGAPGVGKTTLALSAPDPILIDFDGGVSRVEARYWKLTAVVDTYEELLKDLEEPEFKGCKSVIIDTGGAFVGYLQDWAMRSNPAVNRQKNGALSLKGFGAVKQEFQRFSHIVRDVMKKNLIYVFHSEEQKDKDGMPQQRLLCEGAARNLVWQPCDFGGYVQMIGDSRVIGFSPTQEYFAKGCFGVDGQIPVPSLKVGDSNDFLSRLFDKSRAKIEEEKGIFEEQNKKYSVVMEKAREIVSKIETAEQATEAVNILQTMNHSLTSKKESSALLSAKAKKLGFRWDKQAGAYVIPEPEKEGAENGNG